MKAFIVPVDLSDVSFNAAKYAASLARECSVGTIVLYHTVIATDREIGQSTDDIISREEDRLKELVEQQLQSLAPDTHIIIQVDNNLLLESSQSLFKRYEASLIIMGITGKNKLEQKLFGSNTINLALYSGCPVLVVPAVARYQDVQRIALGLEFKGGLLEQIPSEEIIAFVKAVQAELMVLNVAGDNEKIPPPLVFAGQQAAHILFDNVKASYHMMDDNDVVRAVTRFVDTNDVQVVITIASEHGFFDRLFKGSTTRDLAFFSTIPLIIYKSKA